MKSRSPNSSTPAAQQMAQQMSCYAPHYVWEHESNGEAPHRSTALPSSWYGVALYAMFFTPTRPSISHQGALSACTPKLSTTVFCIAVPHYSNFIPHRLPSLSKQRKIHPQKHRPSPATLNTDHELCLPQTAALRLSWHISQGRKPPASGHGTASVRCFRFISYNSSSSSNEVQQPGRFHMHPAWLPLSLITAGLCEF